MTNRAARLEDVDVDEDDDEDDDEKFEEENGIETDDVALR